MEQLKLQPENVIVLNAEDSKWFVEQLLNPPAPNERLIKLMTEPSLIDHYSTARVEIADAYATICDERGVRYIDPKRAAAYNGYKFIVLDPFEHVNELGTLLTSHQPTSAVFDTDVLGRPTSLPHWCPPTYTCLRPQ